MSDEGNDGLKRLCDRIANEQDPDKLATLAKELDQLLAREQEERKGRTASLPTKE